MAAKKTPSKKPTSKKSKKTTSKKTTSKKTTSKKTTSKKTTSKKTTSKKTTSKKAPAPSAKPLAMKLGVLSGVWVIDNAPAGFELLLPPTVELGLELQGRIGDGDAVLAFVGDVDDVRALAARWKRFRPKAGEARLWVAYPKGGGPGELNRDRGWDSLRGLGLRPVAQVAVDDVWSALRFRPV